MDLGLIDEFRTERPHNSHFVEDHQEQCTAP